MVRRIHFYPSNSENKALEFNLFQAANQRRAAKTKARLSYAIKAIIVCDKQDGYVSFDFGELGAHA